MYNKAHIVERNFYSSDAIPDDNLCNNENLSYSPTKVTASKNFPSSNTLDCATPNEILEKYKEILHSIKDPNERWAIIRKHMKYRNIF